MVHLLSKIRSYTSLPPKSMKITDIPAQKNLQSLSISKQENSNTSTWHCNPSLHRPQVSFSVHRSRTHHSPVALTLTASSYTHTLVETHPVLILFPSPPQILFFLQDVAPNCLLGKPFPVFPSSIDSTQKGGARSDASVYPQYQHRHRADTG